MDKQTFLQNYHIAQEGGDASEAAIDFLFKQFDFQFGVDDPSSICVDLRPSADENSSSGESV